MVSFRTFLEAARGAVSFLKHGRKPLSAATSLIILWIAISRALLQAVGRTLTSAATALTDSIWLIAICRAVIETVGGLIAFGASMFFAVM